MITIFISPAYNACSGSLQDMIFPLVSLVSSTVRRGVWATRVTYFRTLHWGYVPSILRDMLRRPKASHCSEDSFPHKFELKSSQLNAMGRVLLIITSDIIASFDMTAAACTGIAFQDNEFGIHIKLIH